MAQLLAVRVMRVREYAEDGNDYHDQSYQLPTWELIEATVRSLDHFRLPFVSLGLRDTPAREGWFTVYGGPDAYAITADTRESGRVKYYDPTLTECQTDVWWSGDGYFPAEWHVTRDVELVVRLTRTFSQTGQLDRSVNWQRQL